MIVRLRTMDLLNLTHVTHAIRAPDGGMRVFTIDAQPHDLPPDDADRIRRRLAEIDPEPVPEAPAPPPDPDTLIVDQMPRPPKRRRHP